jgi:hypothetical protein
MTHEQHLYGDQWYAITDSPAAKRRAKSQRPRGSYFEEGTHGQEVPPGKYTYSTPTDPTPQYRGPDGHLGENPGIPPYASSKERGLLTKAEGPDDFDAAVLKHGDLALVAEEMRDTMPQWVLEERLLGEITKRTTLVGDEAKKMGWWKGSPLPDDRVVGPNEGRGVAPGVILDDVTKSGDHLALARRGQRRVRERVNQQKRRDNRTPEQREVHLASERERDNARWRPRTPEQRERRNARDRKRSAAKREETT